MKPLLLPALALLLAGCQPDKPAATTATPQPPPADQPAPTAAAGSATASADTLAVADSLGYRVGILQLRPSTQAAFEQLPAGPLPARPSDRESQSNVPDAPLPADGRVQRLGERLVLRPARDAATRALARWPRGPRQRLLLLGQPAAGPPVGD